MKPILSVHAGEYLTGSCIERKFRHVNLWVPAKDTGIDLLVSNRANRKTVSLQVKFSKDFLVAPGHTVPERRSRLMRTKGTEVGAAMKRPLIWACVTGALIVGFLAGHAVRIGQRGLTWRQDEAKLSLEFRQAATPAYAELTNRQSVAPGDPEFQRMGFAIEKSLDFASPQVKTSGDREAYRILRSWKSADEQEPLQEERYDRASQQLENAPSNSDVTNRAYGVVINFRAAAWYFEPDSGDAVVPERVQESFAQDRRRCLISFNEYAAWQRAIQAH